ncbi:type II secretion system F family protein [bacterium]|nr:MAG: type II secretion system F family protein [bacterium]
MPRFRYQALDAKGSKTSGEADASDVKALSETLRGQGFFLVDATAEKPSPEEAAAAAEPSAASLSALAGARERTVPLEAVAMFTSQLAIMVRTALPLMESLTSLARQQGDPTFKAILLDIGRGVQHGSSLSQCCARYPKVFDEVYVSLLAAGEASGNMHTMLERLAAYLQFQRELRGKVRSAVLYPAIVVVTAFSVVAFLVLFIMPTFAEVFSQFELKLPLPTRALLGLSAHLRGAWYWYVGAAAALWGYAASWLSRPANVKSVHTFQLDLPVAGTLVRNIVLTRTLRTLAALVASGVPILKSLDMTKASAGNVVFHDLLVQVHLSASEGRGLASAFAKSPYFPELVANMVANAEKTGTLPETLAKMADYYESETDTAIKDLFSVMEPIFVVGLGLIVAGIAVAILLPIFELGNAIQ